MIFRPATVIDIPQIQIVIHAGKENTLASLKIGNVSAPCRLFLFYQILLKQVIC